jgi:hypothetical protein
MSFNIIIVQPYSEVEGRVQAALVEWAEMDLQQACSGNYLVTMENSSQELMANLLG